jgi:thioredoxin reductase
MEKIDSIHIIGASNAALSFVKRLRELGVNYNITLVDWRQFYFDRFGLFDYFKQHSNINLLNLEKFAQQYRVNFINDKVEKVNFRRQLIYLKQHDKQEYQNLIFATGACSKKKEIRGEHKKGFYYFDDIDPLEVAELFKLSEDIVVSASTILGIKLALALKSQQKEIRLIIPDSSFLGGYHNKLPYFCQHNAIDLYQDCRIEEVIGESMVKATKISRPKLFSSQLVFVDSGFEANDVLFGSLCQKDYFFTDYDNVYLLGAAANKFLEDECFFFDFYKNIKNQAEKFADYLVFNKLVSNLIPAQSRHRKEHFLQRFFSYSPPLAVR